jgi:DHA1 family inner membrane transport protein
MLAALLLTCFFLMGTAVTMSPFLLDMADDFGVELGWIAQMVTYRSVAWALAALAAGVLSDRIGRRPILAVGVFILGAGLGGVCVVESYLAAAVLQFVSGLGGGAFMGCVLAAVADRVPATMRGRAVSIVMSGQSLAMIFGVPAVTYLGADLGWRGALAIQAVLLMASAPLVWSGVPAVAERRAGATASGSLRSIARADILMLLGAGVTERVAFGTVTVFFATVLIVNYELSFDVLAVVLGAMAIGAFAGGLLGGVLADRVRSKLGCFAMGSLVAGLLAIPLLSFQLGVFAATMIAVAFSLVNGASRPPLLAALADLPPHVRGTIMGVNFTASATGWTLASTLGSLIIAASGFAALGPFVLVVSIVGAVLVLLSARSSSATPEPAARVVRAP